MSDTTTCTSCGASVPAGATFCTNCGAKVGGSAPEANGPATGTSASDTPEATAGATATAAEPPPAADATRVDNPGLGDPTQVFRPPPGPDQAAPPAAAPWQPAETPSHPPAAAPWDPPATSAAAPSWPQPPPSSGAPGGWAQPGSQAAPDQWGAPAPGQWGAPAPTASQASSAGAKAPSPLGGIAAAVGAVLVIAGLFLPWIANNQDVAGYEASGWDLTSGDRALESVDPYIVLGLGIGALVIAALLFVGIARPVVRIAAVVAGIAVVGILVRDWLAITDLVADDAAVTSSFEVTAQLGFYLTIAGGVVLALSALAPGARTASSARP